VRIGWVERATMLLLTCETGAWKPAQAAAQREAALKEDWKGQTKGPKCVPFVAANYSTMAQCSDMLTNMEEWSA